MGSSDQGGGTIVRRRVNPRTILVGVWIFVVSPALYFLGRAKSRQEDKQLRLCEPQRVEKDVDVPDHSEQVPQTVLLPDAFRRVPSKDCSDVPEGHSQQAPRTVLPPEVFREVPPDECAPSKLLEKTVDRSHYEFGCEEIEVRREAWTLLSSSSPSCDMQNLTAWIGIAMHNIRRGQAQNGYTRKFLVRNRVLHFNAMAW